MRSLNSRLSVVVTAHFAVFVFGLHVLSVIYSVHLQDHMFLFVDTAHGVMRRIQHQDNLLNFMHIDHRSNGIIDIDA